MSGKVLYLKERISPVHMIVVRLTIVLLLLGFVAFIFWIDRDGLDDTRDHKISPLDVIYFTAVTVTTTGYGDIRPVSDTAMIFDSFIATPIRALIWIIFIGTTYQLVVERYMEERKLKQINKHLDMHTIIVGFGIAGRTAAEELMAKGLNPEKIVIIDKDEKRIQEAADLGFIALCGDASKEILLEKASIKKAKNIIVATDRDDTNILIILTVKDLNDRIEVVSRANEHENEKILRKSGAMMTISPSIAGGSLLATAIHKKNIVGVLQDFLTSKEGMTLNERTAIISEVGKKPKTIEKIVVIGVKRNHEIYDISHLDDMTLQENDVLLFLEKINRKTQD